MYGARAYQQVNVTTASPWKLIDMLYEAAIKRIDEGLLEKAKLIVSEGLYAGLNPDVEFSKSYAKVYDTVLDMLNTRATAPVARQMLVELREGWAAVRNVQPSSGLNLAAA